MSLGPTPGKQPVRQRMMGAVLGGAGEWREFFSCEPPFYMDKPTEEESRGLLQAFMCPPLRSAGAVQRTEWELAFLVLLGGAS